MSVEGIIFITARPVGELYINLVDYLLTAEHSSNAPYLNSRSHQGSTSRIAIPR